MSDQRARDIIDELGERAVCGTTMLERVGRRAWTRPRVAVSGRLYKQYRVPDPWDPNSATDERSIGLGPVSLRLGEKKREPAPHLKPKPSKKEKARLDSRARAQNQPPRFPDVPKASPTKSPKPAAAKPGTQKAAKEEAEAARAAEVAAKMRAAEAARGPRPIRQLSRSEARAAKEKTAVPIPTRPDLQEPQNEPVDDVEPQVAKPIKRSRAGRFRMPRAATTQAPIVRSQTVQEHEKERTESPEQDVPVAPPPRQRTMPSIGGGSMDDLFGAAAQMGRVSLRPPKAEEETDDE